MWTGSGPREVRQSESFKEAFLEPPAVTVGISMWDIDHKTNSRIDISAEKIPAAGFEIVFRTWADTRIARIRADWLAIGPARDEDDWDVASTCCTGRIRHFALHKPKEKTTRPPHTTYGFASPWRAALSSERASSRSSTGSSTFHAWYNARSSAAIG